MSEAPAPPPTAPDEPTTLVRSTLPDGRTADVHLPDGRVHAVEDHVPGRPTPSGALDLAGALLLPALVDGHAHLDKTLLGAPWRPHRTAPRPPCASGSPPNARPAAPRRCPSPSGPPPSPAGFRALPEPTAPKPPSDAPAPAPARQDA
ncbi:hypothetical protein [Streptomyces sp. NBC_00233]|uniref:hypothetical protein n=1 Tax=Streptomyces sp. NBC_00233 TaxID=2975686 RepID=UPI00224F9788|nr:hypothetical protein [Streptomyces sp. NBC_00233]MCX5225452.1 hypothetical protein [Streptomyces sp. NBC_00233]